MYLSEGYSERMIIGQSDDKGYHILAIIEYNYLKNSCLLVNVISQYLGERLE